MQRLLTEKHLLKKISPEDLDNYLAKAWYRLGATIFTTQYLFLENNLYSPIWIRLPLKEYRFRKRLRKIWNRNSSQFRVKIQPFCLDAEKEELFEKYRLSFKGYLSPDIKAYLFDKETSAPFDTYETCIYDGDKLIGYSFFDKGLKSLASIIGVYDPDYQKLSIGFYTMLLEMDYGLQNGFDYFYPGYVIPQYNRFDYKLDIGKPEEVEYFNIKTMNWQPYSSIEEEDAPIQTLYNKYGEICHYLNDLDIKSEVLFYPAYEPEIVKYYELSKPDAPLFISCFSDYFIQPQFMVFYDLIDEHYYLYQNSKVSLDNMNWEDSAQPDNQKGLLMEFLKYRKVILKTPKVFEILLTIKALDKKLQKKVFPNFWDGFPT